MNGEVDDDVAATVGEALALVDLAAGTSDDAAEHRQELRTTLNYALSLRTMTPLEIVPDGDIIRTLDLAIQQVTEALQVDQDISGPNVRHAWSTLAQRVWDWPSPQFQSAEDVGALSTALHQSADAHGERLREALSFMQAELDQRTSELSSLREMVESVRADLSQEARDERAAIASETTSARSAMQQLEASGQSALQQVQDAGRRFNKEFTEAQSTRAEQYEKDKKDRDDRFDAGVSNQAERGETALGELNETLRKANVLEQLMASAATANRWGSEADDQQKAANTWRLTTVILGVISVVVVLVLVLKSDGDTTVAEILGRVSLGLLLAAVTGYAGQQSLHHRQREADARARQIKVETFEVFLRDLPAAAQSQGRQWFVRDFFGAEIDPVDPDENPDDAPTP